MQVAEGLVLGVEVEGTREAAAEYSATAKIFQENNAAVERSARGAASATREMDQRAAAVSRAFRLANTETAGLQSQIRGLASDLQAAGYSTRETASRLSTLKAELKSTGLPARELDAHFKALETSSTKVSDIFKGALAAGFVQAGIQRAAATVKDFVKTSVEASVQMERLERGFKFAGGSADAGAEEFSFVRGEAKLLGLELGSTAAEYTKLTAAAKGTALAGKPTRDIFVAVSEAGTALSLSADSQAGALTALQQIMSKGTVQAEELRGQLGERLPGAFQIAARAMGVSTSALSKMLEQGQVLSTDFIPKFAAQLHDEMGAAAAEAAGGAQQSFNRFSNAVLEAKASLGEELMPVLTTLAEYTANEAIPWWTELIHTWQDGRKEAKEIREEMERLKEAGVPGGDMAIQAGLNIKARREAMLVAKHLQEQERLKYDAYPHAAAPTSEAPVLSQDRISTIANMEKELATAKAQATREGAELEIAVENATYKKKLEVFKGKTAELELAKKIHVAKLAEIDQKAADQEIDAQVRARETLGAISDAKLKAERATRDRGVQDDESRTRSYYEGQKFLREQDSEMEADAFEKQRLQSALHFQEVREATMQALLDTHATRAEIQARMTAVDKKESEARKRIAREEALVRSEFAADMGSNLISAMDAFYSESKKNAGLHQTMAIAQIEIDGAMAAMKAYESAMDSGIPYPGNMIAGVASAALVELKTQAIAMKASRQHFAQGGIVEGPYTTGDRIPIRANAGEMVLTHAQQANLFAMANGQGGGRITHNTFNLDYTAGDNTFGGGQSDWGFDLGELMRRQPHAFAKAFEELVKKRYLQGVL